MTTAIPRLARRKTPARAAIQRHLGGSRGALRATLR